MYRIEAIYNTYRILSVIPLHGLFCFFKTICIMWFLIVWRGLVLETFWYEVHMSISFRYLSAIGVSQWIDIYRWSDSPDDGDIGSLRVLHFHRPLALSVNPTLQEHPSFQRVRSTPGQRVKVNSRSMDEGHWRIQGHWKKNNLCSRNEDCYKICLMDMYLQIKFA